MHRLYLFITAICFLSPVLRGEEAEIDFNRDIRPILSGKCFACHGPDEEERAADLRLDTYEGATEDLGGYAAIVPGNAEDSETIYRVVTDDEDEIMPPPGKGKPLTKDEIALLERWVEQGAHYAKHWAYEKPTRPEVPAIAQKDWLQHNEIDSFIQRRLASEGLAPSDQADRLTLARRASLDLLGVPPTWEQAQEFVNDKEAGAYERYVDRLLAQPTYGERWAEFWLDMARYADSAGYADDRPRTIWAYRDWVIQAFNRNQPFDQFTIDQIAGDLVPEPSDDQLIATAFHRNTLTNNEGGTQDEEFRNAAVVDRVNTTMEVWMGTTMACAQCHTHKYDPLTHDEYFQMFDYFNQSEDADRRDESPLLEIWTDEQIARKEQLSKSIEALKKTLNADTPAIDTSRQQWLAGLKAQPDWTPLAAATAQGGNLKIGEDGWLTLEGDRPKTGTYDLVYQTKPTEITGLKIDISPDQVSNFVLSKVEARWEPIGDSQALKGRYVKVVNPGKAKLLHLAEVEVFSQGVNVARQGKATQSSTGYGGAVGRAIDGNTDGDYSKNSVTHTNSETDPWLEIDLGEVKLIDAIKVWNRTDGNLESRLKGYRVEVLDAEKNVIWDESPGDVPSPSKEFALTGAKQLNFSAAFANHEQNGFPAKQVLEKLNNASGWAIAGRTGQVNQLTLTLPSPVELGEGELMVKLYQQSKYGQHMLTHFRLASTTDKDLTAWAVIPAGIRVLVSKPSRTADEEKKIATFYRTIAKELDGARQQLASQEKQLRDAKPSTTVPIMREVEQDKERTTKLQVRGNYLNTTHELKKAVPAVFHPMAEGSPNNRLGLAQWLMDQENPLTARVLVNRFWEHIFGTGIVQTSEEFGSQGELPSHPEMLDWMATEFQKDWDVKRLLKLMVTSATYRQKTEADPELLEEDPFNRLYARGPRFRVSAAMVRDQALFVSGLLSDKMYGPPVNPPQPNLGLKAAFGGATDWKTSAGEDKFRRGIYTSWRRSSPYPSMATFDAPNREVCVSRRGRTNTPLQALVTLNDPVYVEAAQSLARKAVAEGGETTADRIRYVWRRALVREPRASEIERVTALLADVYDEYQADAAAAKQMATMPIGAAPAGADVAELAAWTVVGNVVLNLDEIFLKR